MIESIKTKLWDLLKEKEVSLAMLYNKNGEILWHKGRKITGKTIHQGEGFSKSYIKKTLNKSDVIELEDVLISSTVNGLRLPESASVLKVKCLIIQPVSDNFYLYIDSGTKDSFSQSDREIFKFMGEFLGEMVEQIKKNEINIGGITGSSEEIKKIRELVLKYSLEEEPVSFQAKLLRFIETKKYIVLGESAEREADVRIVAATNKDLQKAIKTKEFREDLYFRLQVLEIEIPPLRERKQDIKTLVMEMQRFLRGKEIGNDFWEAVYNHDWPGNVRELIMVLTRAGILVDSPITGKDIRDSIKAGKSFWETVKAPYLNRDLNRDEVKEIIKRGLDQSDGKYKNLLTLFNLEDNEYKKFMKFLNGNRLNI